MQRFILHFDMNSYFASVEQQANPLFRGKPVGVCAYLSPNGCIIASSVEAKRLGIKTGCRVSEARKIYPKIILVENDPSKYRTVTGRIFKIVAGYGGVFEPYSIDEGFLDLTGLVCDFNQAAGLAHEIRHRIKAEVGDWLKCSIGLSFTKFLAKFCSDTATKDGLKIIATKLELDSAFKDYQLTDLWGIGVNIERRLNNLGITTILDLKNYPVENLIRQFGKAGYFLWAKVNGVEIENLVATSDLISKSIGHSYCLAKQTADPAYLQMILRKLIGKVGSRLRSNNLVAGGLCLGWSYISGNGFSRTLKLSHYVATDDEIFCQAQLIFNNQIPDDKVRMLFVSVFNLTQPSRQLNLFNNIISNKLSKALDNLKQKYGQESIYVGRLYNSSKLAVDRIGFRKIDQVDYQL